MITRKQIEEILDDTLEGDNPPDSAPTVVGKEECVNRLMKLVKNCSIPNVVGRSEQLFDFLICQCDEPADNAYPNGTIFCENCGLNTWAD